VNVHFKRLKENEINGLIQETKQNGQDITKTELKQEK